MNQWLKINAMNKRMNQWLKIKPMNKEWIGE